MHPCIDASHRTQSHRTPQIIFLRVIEWIQRMDVHSYVRPVRRIGTKIRSGPVRSGPRSRIGLALISVRIGLTIFFVDARISTTRKVLKKKYGTARSMSSENRQNRSYPQDFLSRLKFENSLATFGRIQPIVSRFIALYPLLWHKSPDDRPNSPKSGVRNFEILVFFDRVLERLQYLDDVIV